MTNTNQTTNPNRYDELGSAQQEAIDRLINAIASSWYLKGHPELVDSTTALVHAVAANVTAEADYTT